MEGIECEICSLTFDDSRVIPKMLPCGHSLCLPCLEKLVVSNPMCPKCRLSIGNEGGDYPTNFALLAIVNAHSKYDLMKTHVACRLQAMNDKFSATKESMTKLKTQINLNLEVVESALSQVEELSEQNSDELDVQDVNKTLSSLEEDHRKLKAKSSFDYWNMRMNVSLKLNSFKNTEEYLDEIYSMLQGGNPIFSISMMEDTFRYGRITTDNNMILVHSLNLETMPIGQTSVWFDDFKTCIASGTIDFRVFLKLSCNSKGIINFVCIKLHSSQLAPQFIRLCTGECGPSYKGCSYKRKSDHKLVVVEMYQEGEDQKIGNIDYGWDSEDSDYTPQSNEIIVLGSSDGSFQIRQLPKPPPENLNVIGEIIYPENLGELITQSEVNNLKIVDCGFFFEF